jgi:hypothetical protein
MPIEHGEETKNFTIYTTVYTLHIYTPYKQTPSLPTTTHTTKQSPVTLRQSVLSITTAHKKLPRFNLPPIKKRKPEKTNIEKEKISCT